MLALRSLLPHLGLFLCLALRFSLSLSTSDNGSCVVFDEVYDSNDLGINTTAVVSGGDTVYTGESKPLTPLPFVLRGALSGLSNIPYVCGHDGKWGAVIDRWQSGLGGLFLLSFHTYLTECTLQDSRKDDLRLVYEKSHMCQNPPYV